MVSAPGGLTQNIAIHLLNLVEVSSVNLKRIGEIRARRKGEGWELRMEPPVNRVIPIGETYEATLWKAFEV